jgi:hypothetical protein
MKQVCKIYEKAFKQKTAQLNYTQTQHHAYY